MERNPEITKKVLDSLELICKNNKELLKCNSIEKLKESNVDAYIENTDIIIQNLIKLKEQLNDTSN